MDEGTSCSQPSPVYCRVANLLSIREVGKVAQPPCHMEMKVSCIVPCYRTPAITHASFPKAGGDQHKSSKKPAGAPCQAPSSLFTSRITAAPPAAEQGSSATRRLQSPPRGTSARNPPLQLSKSPLSRLLNAVGPRGPLLGH